MTEPEGNNTPGPLQLLMNTIPQVGRVEWLGLRPARNATMIEPDRVCLIAGEGLQGDRFKGSKNNPRQITLLQYEHLAVIAACVGSASVDPAMLRRNIVVSGINLLALKQKLFQVGDCMLEGTGPCHPCSKMERLLGPGGYNAMRGHGGITARVIEGGTISLGDRLVFAGVDF